MSSAAPRPPDDDSRRHWLLRASSIRLLWRIGFVVLALTVLAQFGVHIHEYFGVDGWFGFYAVFGFVTCVGMVVFAKLLGFAVKRPDDYYDDEGGPEQ